jgi:hypothetical protein
MESGLSSRSFRWCETNRRSPGSPAPYYDTSRLGIAVHFCGDRCVSRRNSPGLKPFQKASPFRRTEVRFPRAEARGYSRNARPVACDFVVSADRDPGAATEKGLGHRSAKGPRESHPKSGSETIIAAYIAHTVKTLFTPVRRFHCRHWPLYVG